MHEHKASGFILTLNEKLANYSSDLINMQTDICYLGVNSRGIFLGGGEGYLYTSLISGYCGIAAWDSPTQPPESGAPYLSSGSLQEGKEGLAKDGGQPGTQLRGGGQRGTKLQRKLLEQRAELCLGKRVEQAERAALRWPARVLMSTGKSET